MHTVWKWTKQFINRRISALLIFKQEVDLPYKEQHKGTKLKEKTMTKSLWWLLWICRNRLHVIMSVIMALCVHSLVLETKNIMHSNFKSLSRLWSMIEGVEESGAAVLAGLQLLSDQWIPSHVSVSYSSKELLVK